MLFRSRTHADPIETVLFLSSGTHGRAQMPTIVVSGPTVRTTVVASGYFTDEGLILRNESSLHENLREACAAYGFGTITWLDDQTPVV